MNIRRRDFLLGLGSLVAPGWARGPRNPRTIVMHYDAASASPAIHILNSAIPPVAIHLAQVKPLVNEYLALLRQPPWADPSDRLRTLSQQLYLELWKLPETVTSGTEILIRASGILKNLPFESLFGTKYVGEEFIIRYVVGTGKEICRPEMASLAHGKNFVYAPATNAGLEVRRLGDGLREAKTVRGLIGAKIRIGPGATKDSLRQDVRQPFNILHIASHGFRTQRRPREQCLVLRKRVPEGVEAGIDLLTSSEVRAMRARGRLVVLSTCDSAAGVADLQQPQSISRAFLAAGVTEVIASRWQVDDAATFEFMKVFYEQLAAGRDAATALRSTRAVMIRGSNLLPLKNPYFWAAFADFVYAPQRVR